MNDQDDEDIERRLREWGAAARNAAPEVRLPAFRSGHTNRPIHRATRRARTLPLLAAAAVLIAIAGGVTVTQFGGGDHHPGPAAVTDATGPATTEHTATGPATTGRTAATRSGSMPNPSKKPADTGAPASPVDLVALTKDVPCPGTATMRPASRATLKAFHPVAALTCTYTDKTFPNGDRWTVETRKATATGIDDLVRALSLPDDPFMPPGGTPCSLAVVVPQPWSLLVDSSGHYLDPPLPTGTCGMPLPAVAKALNALSWQTLSHRKTTLQASAASIAASCGMHDKNMPYLSAHALRPPLPGGDGGPVFTDHPDARLKMCVYRTSASDLSAGTFLRGSTLDQADSARLRAALTGRGPASSESCPGQREFATITAGHGATDYLELGGCWRLVRTDVQPMSFGAASAPHTVQRILGLG